MELLEVEDAGTCARAAIHTTREIEVCACDLFRIDALKCVDEPLHAVAELVQHVVRVLEPEIGMPLDAHDLTDGVY